MSFSRCLPALLAAAVCGSFALSARASETVQVRGGEHDEGYARIAVEWVSPVAFDAHLSGNTLTIHFARPFTTSLVQLPSQLRHYLSQAAQSADGTSIIATLTRPVDIKVATVNGTIVSVDLFARSPAAPEKQDAKIPAVKPPGETTVERPHPEKPLPPAEDPGSFEPSITLVDAIATAATGAPVNLLQMAQTAGTLDPAPVAAAPEPVSIPAAMPPAQHATPETVRVRSAEHGEGRARIAVQWRSAITYDAKVAGDTLTIHFKRPFAAQLGSLTSQLDKYIASAEQSPDQTSIVVKLKQPMTIETSTIDGKIAAIDLTAQPSTSAKARASDGAATKAAERKNKPQPTSMPKAEMKKAEGTKLATGAPEPKKDQPPLIAPPKAEAQITPPATAAPALLDADKLLPPPPPSHVASPAVSAPMPVAPMAAKAGENADGLQRLEPTIASTTDRASLRFDWSAPVGVAVYRRGSAIWIVFAAPSELDLSAIALQGQSVLRAIDPIKADGATALRLVTSDAFNPSVRRVGDSWIVELSRQEAAPDAPIIVDPRPDPAHPSVELHVRGASQPLRLRDPLLGDTLTIVPVEGLGRGIDVTQDFVDFRLLPSMQGIVIRANSDDLDIAVDADAVHITRPHGLVLSDDQDRLLGRSVAKGHRIFDFATWRGSSKLPFADRRSALERIIAAAAPAARTGPRIDLARFYFANLFGTEALSVLDQLNRDDPQGAADSKLHALRGGACLLTGMGDCATRELGDATLDNEPEAGLWRGSLAAEKGDWSTASREFLPGVGLLISYPKRLRDRFALQAAEAMLASDRGSSAAPLIDLVLKDNPAIQQQAMAVYLQGRVAQQLGKLTDALELWSKAAGFNDRKARARALYAKVMALYEAKRASRADTIKALDALRFSWRGDDFEFTLLRRLGELKLAEGDPQGGLETLHLAAAYFPDYPAAKDVAKEAMDAFADVFIGKGADDVPPVKALALYDVFRDLDPPGERHDAIVKKLVDRLVSVDLLDRAASLLEEQVKTRLSGVEKARAATQVALLRLMNHQPDAAIATLDLDVSAGLTPDLARQRQELHARALLDLNLAPEALAMLGTDNSRDAYRLRADIYWRQRDWKNAAKIFALLAGEPPSSGPLDPETARIVMSWAAALTLDGDQSGVTKLRHDFGTLMAGTQSADAFNIITGDAAAAAAGGGNPNEIAARVAQIGTLQNFMASYKQRLATSKLSAIN